MVYVQHMSESEKVIQIVVSALKPDASRERFFELTRDMVEWLEYQQGFEGYELYEGPDGMADTITYSSMDSATRINQKFTETNIFKEMVEMIESDYRGLLGSRVKL